MFKKFGSVQPELDLLGESPGRTPSRIVMVCSLYPGPEAREASNCILVRAAAGGGRSRDGGGRGRLLRADGTTTAALRATRRGSA